MPPVIAWIISVNLFWSLVLPRRPGDEADEDEEPPTAEIYQLNDYRRERE